MFDRQFLSVEKTDKARRGGESFCFFSWHFQKNLSIFDHMQIFNSKRNETCNEERKKGKKQNRRRESSISGSKQRTVVYFSFFFCVHTELLKVKRISIIELSKRNAFILLRLVYCRSKIYTNCFFSCKHLRYFFILLYFILP